MHNTKSRAKGISSSSLFDLKAELSKKEEEISRDKAAGKKYIFGGVGRPDKKSTKWGRPNKGVQDRVARDVAELETVSQPTLENVRISLARKTKKYRQLRKGKTAGLTEKQLEALLVDFDAKGIDSNESSDSDDADESLNVPMPHTNDEDDPIVEYVDEYGRSRTARRSEVPRLAKPDKEDEEDDNKGVIRHPQDLENHFPTYQPDEARVAQIINEHSEENNPLEKHYDPSSEIRDRGAASYNFSRDAQTRQARMDDLKSSHLETNVIRKEMGAVDVRPGEIEGMQAPEVGSSFKGSEKRKRETEKRRKMLESKRKKAKTNTEDPQFSSSLTSTASNPADSKQNPDLPHSLDPFAVLELASLTSPVKNGEAKAISQDADDFLAQLETEMLNKKRE